VTGVDVSLPVRRDLHEATLAAAAAESLESQVLIDHLYARWFLGLCEQPSPVGPPEPIDLEPADALRGAHHDSGRWSEGWTVARVSSRGRILATNQEASRVFDRVDVLPVHRPCLPPRVGDEVSVTCRRDHVDEDKTFWFTAGGDWDDTKIQDGLVRLYWNMPLRQAPGLVRRLTSALAETVDGYALKVWLTDGRSDGTVLYLRPEGIEAAFRVLRPILSDFGPELRPQAPPLTLNLGPGLGLAEDPGGGESFGQSRCRLIAEGFLAARRQGVDDPEGVTGVLQGFLRDAGLDPERPYLRPGSGREYRWN
jgi:type III HopA1-like effector protein